MDMGGCTREGSTSVQPFLWKTQRKLLAFLTHRSRKKSCERWGPMLAEAWDSQIGWWLPATRERMSQAYMFVM